MIKPDKRKAIYYLYKEGMSIREISCHLKVGRNTVRAIIDQNGIEPELRRKDRIEIDPQLLVRLYNECNGWIQRIHEKLTQKKGIKIGYSTLTKMIREFKLGQSKMEPGKNHAWIKKFDKYMIKAELYKCMINGKSYTDILQQMIFYNIGKNDLLLNDNERELVIKSGQQGKFKIWRYGIAIEMFGLRITKKTISEILDISRSTIRRKIKEYNEHGFDSLFNNKYNKIILRERTKLKTKRVLEILHQKPNLFGINRSNWNRDSIAKVYEEQYGEKIGISTVGHLINNAGYKMKKAKKVLTSPDPNYREKVELLLKTIQSLNSDEMFFFIDELGPLQVKKYGGRCYVKKEEMLRLPKVQKSKGSIILFGALSATTNQVTWCYGKAKDSSAMISLIEILFNQYHQKSKLYITWDAVSWHRSNELEDWMDIFNAQTKEIGIGPIIEVIPLPSSSQFLDVIEAVFSGMKRAVIHHSDYQSEEEMKSAISEHFKERNEYFRENPRRAGKKIWEIDFFLDYNNIKYGDYMEW